MRPQQDNSEGQVADSKRLENYFTGKGKIENKLRTIKLTQHQVRRRGDGNQNT